MRDVKLTIEEADLTERLVRLGLERAREVLADSGALRLGPIRAGWEATREVATRVCSALVAEDGAVLYAERRPARATEGE